MVQAPCWALVDAMVKSFKEADVDRRITPL